MNTGHVIHVGDEILRVIVCVAFGRVAETVVHEDDHAEYNLRLSRNDIPVSESGSLQFPAHLPAFFYPYFHLIYVLSGFDVCE